MKSAFLVLAVVAACGDNSDECGPGTTAVSGVCVPAATCGSGTKPAADGTCIPDGTIVCGDGTVFDPVTSTCVIDPNACQAGTVLIDGMCLDPNNGLVVDVEEGPEPNGLGVIEQSVTPAGIIAALKPIGGPGLVIHGHIDPFQDADHDGALDPDADTYLIEVTAPTLVHITATGAAGVTAGFFAAPNGAIGPLASWFRVGVNLSGDTSKRQLYLPAAGEYILAITDSRTLYEVETTHTFSGAPGGPNGDYYVTIDTLQMPEPTPLVTTNQTATDTGTFAPDETKFYSLPMGSGLNAVTVDVPSSAVVGSFAVFKNGVYQEAAEHQRLVGGYHNVDLALIAVEPIMNLVQGPVAYTITVNTRDALSLSTVGASSPAALEGPNTPSNAPVELANYSQFYFDTLGADQSTALQLAWTHAVRGGLVDENGDTVDDFVTWIDQADTWASFAGDLRLHLHGRYYFVVYDPTGTPGTTQLAATSAITPVVTGTITTSTPTGPIGFGADFQYLFVYDAGTVPWQTFDATGTNTGGQTLELFDADLAYGRLDPLMLVGGATIGVGSKLVAHTFTEGGGPFGRILLDDGSTQYVARVSAIAPGASPMFSLTFAPRTFTDLGSGATLSSTHHALTAGDPPAYFLYSAIVNTTETITVHPQLPALLDTQFQLLANDESPRGSVVDTTTNGDDTTQHVQSGEGWTAFSVTAATPPADTEFFDVTVTQ